MRSKKFLPVIIVFLIITLVFIVGDTFAKYVTKAEGSDKAIIAIMASDTSFNFDNLKAEPGSVNIIPFTLTNSLDGKTCEVTQTYKMSIENSENIPYEYELCKDSECESVINKSNGFYSDSSFRFNAGVSEEKEYYLKVSWPENKNDASYAFEVDYIRLKIDVVQVD
ncbi:MAG: hypothetical protein IKF91_03870 [Bacilli bacterium]|nr:hypothetical protein [Bacilli bacterium]